MSVTYITHKFPHMLSGPATGHFVWRKPETFYLLPESKRKPSQKRIDKMLCLLAVYALSSSILIDDEGHIIGGIEKFRDLSLSEPSFLPAYLVPCLSMSDKQACLIAYKMLNS